MGMDARAAHAVTPLACAALPAETTAAQLTSAAASALVIVPEPPAVKSWKPAALHAPRTVVLMANAAVNASEDARVLHAAIPLACAALLAEMTAAQLTSAVANAQVTVPEPSAATSRLLTAVQLKKTVVKTVVNALQPPALPQSCAAEQ